MTEFSELQITFFDYLTDIGYSESTIKTYCYQVKRFLNFIKIDLANITGNEIRKYFVQMVKDDKLSVSAQNNAINALKIFLIDFLGLMIEDHFFSRPKKQKKIPEVLNEQETYLILKQINNLKARCMIYLIYSSGLKLTEVIHLKPEHIEFDKARIYITCPRNNCDRYVILSKKVELLLKKYLSIYHPKICLFESMTGYQYSKRKLQKIFQTAVQKSGINKRATLTILRNSFVVHMLEKGIDIRYLQRILGHRNSKSTMKYVRSSRIDIKSIKSPLDNMDL